MHCSTPQLPTPPSTPSRPVTHQPPTRLTGITRRLNLRLVRDSPWGGEWRVDTRPKIYLRFRLPGQAQETQALQPSEPEPEPAPTRRSPPAENQGSDPSSEEQGCGDRKRKSGGEESSQPAKRLKAEPSTGESSGRARPNSLNEGGRVKEEGDVTVKEEGNEEQDEKKQIGLTMDDEEVKIKLEKQEEEDEEDEKIPLALMEDYGAGVKQERI